MKKRFQYSKREHWLYFAFGLKTPYEEGHDDPHNLIHVAVFGHSWWIKVPQWIKPREKWVDLSRYDWAKEHNGKKGYTEQIQRDYGITFTEDAIHVYYGIQPGSWSRNDPENSDHTKLFWYPWNLEIVRHDLLYPDGDVYHRNLYPKKKNGRHLHWCEVLDQKQSQSDAQVQVAEFVELNHFTKDGKNQKARIRLTGEEREWRPKWTRWLPFFKFTKRVVDCESDTELGPRAGSWKGGMMGWSVPWEKDESMKQAFWKWYKKWDGN